MARERGMSVDVAGFEKLMEAQRARARRAQKREVISVSEENLQVEATKFLGYDFLETEAVVEVVAPTAKSAEFDLIVDRTACYAEMGGQVGDTGLIHVPGPDWSEIGRLQITNTQKKGNVFIHRSALADGRAPEVGEAVRVAVDSVRGRQFSAITPLRTCFIGHCTKSSASTHRKKDLMSDRTS